ncbi:hypothetical protein KO504_04970 [Winogradskyella psychrotolerans]|uniref:hypothetical protein n=1 Tax=Winogradskyella psychrotolerans TaxID=1344585 RepID=UPI001C073CA2|nr:hypothetical protein [Winogradskyella psychrotolerans]MBU2920681.1 hypothetical protein [Winogradskyella psychrotolerans]
MSQTNDILELSTQILRPIIFYISQEMLEGLETEHAEILEKIELTNSLMLLDINGDPLFFENKIEHIELLKKEKVLKSNTLKLIEFKAKYDIEAFKYHFEEYINDLEAWIEASDYIRLNAKTEARNYFKEIQPYLQLQYDNLKQHHQELKQRFANVIFKPLQTEVLVKSNINVPKSQTSEKPKKGRKKRVLPSDDEIDNYLLETVFGLDLLKINNKKPK